MVQFAFLLELTKFGILEFASPFTSCALSAVPLPVGCFLFKSVQAKVRRSPKTKGPPL